MKFDLHLNVGTIYRSANPRSKEMQYSGKEIAEYCKHYKLTHAVCIYSHYKDIQELQDNAPDTKIYGVQWMVDLDNQELDIGKPLFYGIKLHSHRGYRPANLYSYEAGRKTKDGLSYGLDYADHKYLSKVLDKLPNGSLVYMHTQGAPDTDNRATPKHLLHLATKYTNLKFIMGHAGGYGAMMAAEPACREIPIGKLSNTDLYGSGIRNYCISAMLVKEAVAYANYTHNIFLDTSICTRDKAMFLQNTEKWAIGSDYPFGENSKFDRNFIVDDFMENHIWNYDFQYDQFARKIGEYHVSKTHQAIYDYIHTPIEELAKKQEEWFKKAKEFKSFQEKQYN